MTPTLRREGESEGEGLAPCKCGGAAKVYPSYGGNGGMQTFYVVECEACKARYDDFGRDGTKRSAIRQWNQMRRGPESGQPKPDPDWKRR